MRHLKYQLAALGLIALGACATTQPGYYPGGSAMRGVDDPHIDPAQQDRLVDCNVPDGHQLTAEPEAARPGDQVALRHSFEFSAYGPQRVPLHCVEYWQIDPPAAAALSGDRRSLRVSADASPGTAISVRVVANGHSHTLILPVLAAGD